ncbi:MAG: hypothetical protein KME16_06315 [Scytolyngbya sp. HA4215-MV1]|jgi:hypothetical protein|nr:hypothetical protein [Scytolyngbya sp. HA4215-MV1]
MVKTVNKTISTLSILVDIESKDFSSQSYSSQKTTSVDSRYQESDPDLSIREYFLASQVQRAKQRKRVFQTIQSWQSVLAILIWSKKRGIADAYEGAVDLLAECTEVHLFQETARYLEASNLLASRSETQSLSNLDDFWEVLIQGVACAAAIPVQERFNLILKLFPSSQRRAIKAAIIDALVILSDEMNIPPIRNSLGRFTSVREPDLYIRNYAEEALKNL